MNEIPVYNLYDTIVKIRTLTDGIKHKKNKWKVMVHVVDKIKHSLAELSKSKIPAKGYNPKYGSAVWRKKTQKKIELLHSREE